MAFIRAIIAGLVTAILDFVWKKKQEPSSIQDEEVPNDIKRDWNDYVERVARQERW